MTQGAPDLPGVLRSPNIWDDPATYELENLGCDPDGVLETAIRELHDWSGQVVLDVGCGSGFHLPRFAADAARVHGVEPHPPLVQRARERVAGLDQQLRDRIEVHAASAERLPLHDRSVDLVHARWAYFFGPGCEPGLAEVTRVLRPGGTATVIDNDPTRSTFGRWFRAALPDYDPDAVTRFWSRQGFVRQELDIRWELPDRATFEAVVRIEFAPERADAILAEHEGSSVDYAINLFHRTS